MNISEGLKKRFVKDYKVPIKLFREPFFTERLISYDPIYKCVDKYQLFVLECDKYESEDDYFNAYSKIKESMMDYIKNTDAYQEFNNLDTKIWAIPTEYTQLPSHDIYKQTSIGRKFMSIDMKKANFSSMSYYNPAIFDNKKTWEEFVTKFTDSEYIRNSKYIREVVLGNCNPKRQTTYEKYLMSQLLSKVQSCIELPPIVFFSNDEIVLDVTDCTNIDKITNAFTTNEITPIRIEVFTLKAILNNKDVIGYIKYFDEDTMELKKVKPNYLPLIMKRLFKKPISEHDLLFEYEDDICELITIPKIKVVDSI